MKCNMWLICHHFCHLSLSSRLRPPLPVPRWSDDDDDGSVRFVCPCAVPLSSLHWEVQSHWKASCFHYRLIGKWKKWYSIIQNRMPLYLFLWFLFKIQRQIRKCDRFKFKLQFVVWYLLVYIDLFSLTLVKIVLLVLLWCLLLSLPKVVHYK